MFDLGRPEVGPFTCRRKFAFESQEIQCSTSVKAARNGSFAGILRPIRGLNSPANRDFSRSRYHPGMHRLRPIGANEQEPMSLAAGVLPVLMPEQLALKIHNVVYVRLGRRECGVPSSGAGRAPTRRLGQPAASLARAEHRSHGGGLPGSNRETRRRVGVRTTTAKKRDSPLRHGAIGRERFLVSSS
jgi:hypothetical protein